MQKILKDFICFDFVCRYDLAKSELDKGKYMLAEENLHKQYSAIKEQKLKDYAVRKRNEEAFVQSESKLIHDSNFVFL